MKNCRICGNKENNKTFFAHEMMFGTKEEFEYFECANCGCIQIKEIPEILIKYYPKKYGSFHEVVKLKDDLFKTVLKRTRADYCLYEKKRVVGKILSKIFGCEFLEKIKPVGINYNDSILDIGSGSGRCLVNLYKNGFTNLTGIDPFIKRDIHYSNGVNIYKKTVWNLEEKYDFIMLNHSFEHLTNPELVLKEIYRILKPGKYVLIRVPVAGSYSWKHYGANWVALDPPRHLHLFTEKSMRIISEKNGFKLDKIIYDSSDKQFWASEQYVRGIPLRHKDSYYENPDNSIFTKKQIAVFKKKTLELNKNKEGDAACFYLQKP